MKTNKRISMRENPELGLSSECLMLIRPLALLLKQVSGARIFTQEA